MLTFTTGALAPPSAWSCTTVTAAVTLVIARLPF